MEYILTNKMFKTGVQNYIFIRQLMTLFLLYGLKKDLMKYFCIFYLL